MAVEVKAVEGFPGGRGGRGEGGMIRHTMGRGLKSDPWIYVTFRLDTEYKAFAVSKVSFVEALVPVRAA